MRGFAQAAGRRLACFVRPMNSNLSNRTGKSTSSRIVDLLFGILFAVLGAAILVLSDQLTAVGSIMAAVVVGGLGIEAIIGAVCGKRSPLARIGPLP
jgi:hypothetical protein